MAIEVFNRVENKFLLTKQDFDGMDRVVDSQIKKLRKSLGESGKQIATVFGRGYKIQ